MASLRSVSLAGDRFRSFVLASFAGLAMMLALVGIYAFTKLSCAQRAREFAVCTALGASPRHLRALVLTSSSPYLLAGTAAGAAGAWVLQRLLSTLVFGLQALSWIPLLAAAGAFATAALVALLLPAARAARANPAAVLREN